MLVLTIHCTYKLLQKNAYELQQIEHFVQGTDSPYGDTPYETGCLCLKDLVSECVLCLSATLDVMPAVYSSSTLSSSSSATTSAANANSSSSTAAASSSGTSGSNSSGRSGSKSGSSSSGSSSASSSRMVLFPAPKAKRTLAAALVPLMDLLLSTENEVQPPFLAVIFRTDSV
jgi:uncharacterized membrane protein YgcG